MTAVYYNEIDPYAAQWLRNLMAGGLIPHGDVDERSIEDVKPDELRGYQQCHFFAGIGGWPLALALAGWPVDRPVWTGSCPCQPFSAAGKGLGFTDQRHLWPAWFHLISQCHPPVVFGEQVAAAVGKGWLDGVRADLEGHGYAIGAAVLPACAAGAPHRRDRLWFVANANDEHAQGIERSRTGSEVRQEPRQRPAGSLCAGDGAVADAGSAGREQGEWHDQADGHGYPPAAAGDADSHRGSAWAGAAWIIGHDGKARRVEPGIRLLAHGVSGRMAVVRPGFEGRAEVPEALHWYSRSGALKGLGNAIVPQVAAQFIAAFLDHEQENRT